MSYHDLSNLQQSRVSNQSTIPSEVDMFDYVKKCNHTNGVGITGRTGREYCLNCGKVLAERTIAEVRADEF